MERLACESHLERCIFVGLFPRSVQWAAVEWVSLVKMEELQGQCRMVVASELEGSVSRTLRESRVLRHFSFVKFGHIAVWDAVSSDVAVEVLCA